MKSRFFTLLFIIAVCGLVYDLALSQYHYFGRNKVQYNQFEWHILKTEHFEIYFYPEIRQIAKWAAAIAEDAYTEYQSRFDFALNKKVPLILYSSHLHFQQTNVTPWLISEGVGGFFEFIKGRVVIPYDGSYSQFKHVVRHELVHVFMTARINREFKDHQINNFVPPPLWFTEGLAECWSSARQDENAHMMLKDAVINGYAVPLSEMEKISGTFLMYKEGEDFLRYISRIYGEDAPLKFLENIWRSERFEKLFPVVLGKTVQEIEQEWLFDLKKRYYPDLASETTPYALDKPVATEGFNSKSCFYITPSGDSLVVFISNRLGYTSVYQKKLNSDDPAEVLIQGEKTGEYETFHLFRSRMDVSPGGLLAFVTKSGATDIIHIYDLKNNKKLFRLKFPEITGVSSPRWDDTGEKIVFSGLHFKGFTDIYVYNFKDSLLSRLTNDFYDDRDPIWFGDSILIFSSDRGNYGEKGYFHLFSLDISSGRVRELTSGKQKDHSPAISPGKRYMIFCSTRSGINNLYITDLEYLHKGSLPAISRVHPYSASVTDPTWIDDYNLLYTAYENSRFILYRTRLDSELTFIAQSSDEDSSRPDWKPEMIDGDRILKEKKYRGKYSLDVAQGQVVQDPIFGTAGGANIVVSDVLGDKRYYILLYNNARVRSEFLNSFNFMITRYSYARRTNWGAALFRLSGEKFNYYDGFYDEELMGGLLIIQYPLSQFNRFEGTTGFSYSRKQWYDSRGSRKAWLLQNYFSYIHDNSIWGISGPIDGSRSLVTVGYTTDIRYKNLSYYTLILDYRRYFRLSLRSAYAVRVMGLASEGEEARRFYIGGSWTLRGYPLFAIWGNKSFLLNQELRFPVLNNAVFAFPMGNLSLGAVQGAFFLDAGNAWEKKMDEIKGAIGIGFRWRIGGYLVLRYDIGRRTDFHTLGKDTFYQFFFGWDY